MHRIFPEAKDLRKNKFTFWGSTVSCLQPVFDHKILEIVLLLLWFCSLRSAEVMTHLTLTSAKLFLREI